jgi:hypothetical protein
MKDFYPSDKSKWSLIYSIVFYTLSIISQDSFPSDFRNLKKLAFYVENLDSQMYKYL